MSAAIADLSRFECEGSNRLLSILGQQLVLLFLESCGTFKKWNLNRGAGVES